MCNHYSSSGKWRDQMGEFSHLRLPVFDTDRPRPNVQGPDIWPAYTGEILRVEEDKLIAEAATWLFVPFWMKKPFAEWRKTNGGCNNAKGETAETSGVFKHAAKVGRCLIPERRSTSTAKTAAPMGKSRSTASPLLTVGRCGSQVSGHTATFPTRGRWPPTPWSRSLRGRRPPRLGTNASL